MTGSDGPPMAPIAAGVPTDWEGPSITEPLEDPSLERDPKYLRLLLILLVLAAFFEGYDSWILALPPPNTQSTSGGGETVPGPPRIPIDLGRAAAFFVARLSDRLGRRPMLLWSV